MTFNSNSCIPTDLMIGSFILFHGWPFKRYHCITWQSTILISSHQWKKWGSCLWQNQLLKITTSCRLINMTHHRLAKNKTKKSIWLNVSQKHMLIKKKIIPLACWQSSSLSLKYTSLDKDTRLFTITITLPFSAFCQNK